MSAEILVSEDGGENILISDAFIKGMLSWWLGQISGFASPSSWPYVLVESLFNRRVEEKAKEMLFTPLGWHHSSLDQLREENGEKKAMERLLWVK